jgi:hypothetical protein
MSFLHDVPSSSTGVLVTFSTGAGVHFGRATIDPQNGFVAAGSAAVISGSTGLLNPQVIGCGQDATVYATSPTGQLILLVTADGGVTWLKKPASLMVPMSQLAVARAGLCPTSNAHIAFLSGAATAGARVGYTRFDGTSFSPPISLSSGTRPPANPMLSIQGNEVFAFWIEKIISGSLAGAGAILGARSTDGGVTFNGFTAVSLTNNGSAAPKATIANGIVSVVYEDSPSPGAAPDRVNVVQSANGGNNWGQPLTVVSEGNPTAGADIFASGGLLRIVAAFAGQPQPATYIEEIRLEPQGPSRVRISSTPGQLPVVAAAGGTFAAVWIGSPIADVYASGGRTCAQLFPYPLTGCPGASGFAPMALQGNTCGSHALSIGPMPANAAGALILGARPAVLPLVLFGCPLFPDLSGAVAVPIVANGAGLVSIPIVGPLPPGTIVLQHVFVDPSNPGGVISTSDLHFLESFG